MGIIGFWNHPASVALTSVLRIPGLASHKALWPLSPTRETQEGFVLPGDSPAYPSFLPLQRQARFWVEREARQLASDLYEMCLASLFSYAIAIRYLGPGLYLLRTMVLKLQDS